MSSRGGIRDVSSVRGDAGLAELRSRSRRSAAVRSPGARLARPPAARSLKLETEYGIAIRDEEIVLADFGTVGTIAGFVAGKTQAR